MKKFISVSAIIVCLFSVFPASAQLSGGLEGAITTSSVKISDLNNEFTNVIKGDGILGFEGGIFIITDIGPLYVKPKLLLDFQNGPLTYSANGVEQSVQFHLGKILVPVLVGFRILPPVLSLEAGPVYNYIFSSTNYFNGNRVDIERSGLGYRIGLNASFRLLNITLSYQGIKNSGSVLSGATYQTPDQLIMGVGIEF